MRLLGAKDMNMAVSDRELALRAIDIEFQREVLDKLVRLETKMDSLVGNGQPGRMKVVEDKVAILEKSDLRNSFYNRVLNGAISAAISLAITLHKYWMK
jgi:hypothetical protein